ncbi:MAG: tetratricopeptide repeat protein [Polyangiaceae bacterium]
MSKSSLTVPVVLLASFLASCAGKPAEAVRPTAPTGSEALGERTEPVACTDLARPVSPLVVDWKSGERTDLEVAMKQGVAVVAYDCKGLRILDGCKLEGSYGFAGVTPKEDLIQISSRDELWANLPLSVGKLEGSLEGSSSIDLAVVLVGKRATLRGEGARAELSGKCEGATHYVKAAHVGAFAMARGEKGKVRAAAELFTVGGGGASESAKRVENRDGNVQSCKGAKPSADAPPDQCGATVRLLLEPLVEKRNTQAAAAPPPPPAPVENPCPAGYALVAGKCAPETGTSGAHLCKSGDAKDCKTQCDAGSIESCVRLAAVTPSATDANALLTRGCDAGLAGACADLGDRKLRTDQAAGLALLEKSCALGEAWVCWNTGLWFLEGRAVPQDENKAAYLVQRGCALGYAPACASHGDLLIAGRGVKQDVARGLSTYQKLCDNGQAYYCHQLGSIYATDRKALADMRLPAPASVTRDVARGVTVWEQGCALGSLWSCALAGQHYLAGDGVKKDPTRAQQLFERGCGDASRNWDSCRLLGEMYEAGNGIAKDGAKAVDYFEKSCPHAGCERAAELLLAGKAVPKDQDRAMRLFEQQCKKGNWGGGSSAPLCLRYGALLEQTDKPKAIELYADHCGRMGTEWVGGKKVSASKTVGGHDELAESCKRLRKLDPKRLEQEMVAACVGRGILCKELEQANKSAAAAAYANACAEKKLRCDDAKRLGR